MIYLSDVTQAVDIGGGGYARILLHSSRTLDLRCRADNRWQGGTLLAFASGSPMSAIGCFQDELDCTHGYLDPRQLVSRSHETPMNRPYLLA